MELELYAALTTGEEPQAEEGSSVLEPLPLERGLVRELVVD
ncbi:MAG TPA: hypothetical protein VJV78_22855 [Polyangiales bacterium]|nr:hypothetical protein [Polyangiales bacterium]